MGDLQKTRLDFDTLLHYGGKCCGIGLFTFMIYRQSSYFPGFELNLDFTRWCLVTVLFAQFLAAYLFRQKAKLRAQHILDVILPFICAGLPFLVIVGPHWLRNYIHEYDLLWFWNSSQGLFFQDFPLYGFSLMAIGEVITIIGMIALSRSFSIATEVRELKTHGPYRWVRHPLYSGEILSLIGWAVYWCNLWTSIGTTLFILLQCWRAKREEAKLTSVYPEYKEFQQRVGFVIPKLSAFKKA